MNKPALRKRLNAAKAVLAAQYRKQFKTPTFDFDSARLIGSNGYYLQWQQDDTRTGSVELWQKVQR